MGGSDHRNHPAWPASCGPARAGAAGREPAAGPAPLRRWHGNARLKYWKVLASELRCCPEHCTAMVKAVLALHYMEHDPFAALRAT